MDKKVNLSKITPQSKIHIRFIFHTDLSYKKRLSVHSTQDVSTNLWKVSSFRILYKINEIHKHKTWVRVCQSDSHVNISFLCLIGLLTESPLRRNKNRWQQSLYIKDMTFITYFIWISWYTLVGNNSIVSPKKTSLNFYNFSCKCKSNNSGRNFVFQEM